MTISYSFLYTTYRRHWKMAVSKYREVHFFLMLLVFFGSIFWKNILTQCSKSKIGRYCIIACPNILHQIEKWEISIEQKYVWIVGKTLWRICNLLFFWKCKIFILYKETQISKKNLKVPDIVILRYIYQNYNIRKKYQYFKLFAL